MRVFNLLKNIVKGIRSAVTTANDYTDTQCANILKPTILLSNCTNMSANKTYTLLDSITNYRLLLFGIYNGNEWKYYVALPNKEKLDISWHATDSTSWYVIMTVVFNSDTSIWLPKYTRSGFGSQFALKVYGLK